MKSEGEKKHQRLLNGFKLGLSWDRKESQSTVLTAHKLGKPKKKISWSSWHCGFEEKYSITMETKRTKMMNYQKQEEFARENWSAKSNAYTQINEREPRNTVN